MDTSDLTQKGIDALKAGDLELARKFLDYAARHNPEDVQAWLWLAGATTNTQERIEYLQKVIDIDPYNKVAAKGLMHLVDGFTPPVQEIPTQAPVHVPPFVIEPEDVPVLPPLPKPSQHVSAFELESHAKKRQQKLQQDRQQERLVFQLRPSIIPGVFGIFWIMVFLVLAASFIIYTELNSTATIGAMILFFILVVLMFASILLTLFRRIFYAYTLTTHNLSVQTSASDDSMLSIPLMDIQSVHCRQSVLGKIFQYGNIIVGVHPQAVDLILKSVPECKKHCKLIQQIIQKAHRNAESPGE